MSVRANVRMSKIMRTLIKEGVRTYVRTRRTPSAKPWRIIENLAILIHKSDRFIR